MDNAVEHLKFPPGKSGGLIEAGLDRALALPAQQTFPPGKSGGLIEASHPHSATVTARTFPPGKSGGLIEATGAGSVGAAGSARFRRVNPAASLKPFAIANLSSSASVRFRRVNPAASLKRLRLASVSGTMQLVSAG